MEELYKLLGLEETESEGAVVGAVKSLQSDLEDKKNIIKGLTNQIKNYEEQVSSIAAGVAEARVKDLVRKVQDETGYHVGKDYMETLNRKAAQHLYATESDKESIWEDMKAHTIAYGVRLDTSKEIDAISGSRSPEGETIQDRRYAKAKKLIDTKQADDWDEAMKIVLKNEDEEKSKVS